MLRTSASNSHDVSLRVSRRRCARHVIGTQLNPMGTSGVQHGEPLERGKSCGSSHTPVVEPRPKVLSWLSQDGGGVLFSVLMECVCAQSKHARRHRRRQSIDNFVKCADLAQGSVHVELSSGRHASPGGPMFQGPRQMACARSDPERHPPEPSDLLPTFSSMRQTSSWRDVWHDLVITMTLPFLVPWSRARWNV